MPIRQSLPPVLRGEVAADLSAASREALAAVAGEAAAEGAAAWLRDECAGRLKQPGATLGVNYLLALACVRNGEVERAHQTLLVLGETLAAARDWPALAVVSDEALVLEHSGAAARLLVRAHEGLGAEPARLLALERAREILPDDPELGLLHARRLTEAERVVEAHALLAEFVPALLAEKRWSDLEEAALAFADAGSAAPALVVLETLPALAQAGEAARARSLFELVWPAIAAGGLAGEAFISLRALVPAMGPAAAEAFRAAILAALKEGPARTLPDPATVIAVSGVADPLKPLIPALERWDAIAKLPPGAAVNHGSFGAGRVRSNDAEVVVSDFEKSKGQRMPYAAALRSLSLLPEDDLRLLRFETPAALAALRADQPGEVLVRALRSLGGEADAAKLKLFLTGHDVVPAKEWTAFWRTAKGAAEADPRIDHRRAFEQRYLLAPADAAGTEAAGAPSGAFMPSLSPRKSPRENLATLRKFLRQHPGEEPVAARRFGRYVEGIAADPEGQPADRARAALYLLRWFPDRAPQWGAVLHDLWEGGLALADLSGEEEQLELLEAALRTGDSGDALLAAADSRFSAVRERGEAARASLDPEGRARLEHTTLDHAMRYPQAALRLLQDWLEGGQTELEPWRAFAAALALIEDKPKPSVSQKVLEWIGEGGALSRRLEGAPCPDLMRARAAGVLRTWRSSDRLFFPVLEAAERAGLKREVEGVRVLRRRATEKMFSQVGKEGESDVPLMTHATWERLKAELERMERELRTTLPATIQKARELGDLKENAEYHAAKHKQALLSQQVAALQLRLARARFIEETEYRDGVVGLGMEVVLESESDLVSYWILGEGEHHHGEHVISHKTPVARALLGKGIGEEVEVGEGESRRRYRIVSVERKLPPAETAPANG